MARFANSVMFTPASSGTVDFVVSAAVQGYMTPALAGAPTGVYKYRAESNDLSQWEIGEGTYTSGTTTLTRTTVLYNSAGTGTASGQSGAGSKISFTIAPNVGLVQTVEDTLGVDQANSFSMAQRSQARANLQVTPKGYLWGCTLSTAGSSATFTTDVGQCADSTGAHIMDVTIPYAKTASAFAIGAGNGSLDTGSIANNTWYHVFVIMRPDTGVCDVLISLSAASPTMPTNYTLSRRIGAMRTNGSAQWTRFFQFANIFYWDAPVFETGASISVGTSRVVQTLTVPTGPSVEAIFYGNASIASSAALWIGPVALTDTAVALNTSPGYAIYTGGGTAGSQQAFGQQRIMTNGSGQIAMRSDTAATAVRLFTQGWIDDRGRSA